MASARQNPNPQHLSRSNPLFVRLNQRFSLSEGELEPPPNQPGELEQPVVIETKDFTEGYGEPLESTLDLDTWNDGSDLSGIFKRVEEEIGQALEQEQACSPQVRKVLFPIIASREHAPPGAGVFQATRKQLEQTQILTLFNGGVEACDGTCAVHDTLPITITQIGVCMVSYQGEQGAWGHRLFRRDLRMRGNDTLEEALELLQRRQTRAGVDQAAQRDQLTELGRRGIMSYMERAILLSEIQGAVAHGTWTAGPLRTAHRLRRVQSLSCA